MVNIPFSFVPPKVLEKLSQPLMGTGVFLSKIFTFLQLDLDKAELKIDSKKYLAMSLTANLIQFVFLTIVLLIFLSKEGNYYLAFCISIPAFFLVSYFQVRYPQVSSYKRIKKLDADLLAALRAIMIQLNSGVGLFEALVIVSHQQFGMVSDEFREVVRKINGGVPQIEALELLAIKNPSPYFRRAIWQIINGMKEGATTKNVIENVIKNLNKEQIIQIEKYGSQLSPIAMFYMIVAVILPALGVTFMIVIASFINLSEFAIKVMFWGLFSFVIFFEIMFFGIIKNKRPSLLG